MLDFRARSLMDVTYWPIPTGHSSQRTAFFFGGDCPPATASAAPAVSWVGEPLADGGCAAAAAPPAPCRAEGGGNACCVSADDLCDCCCAWL